MSSLHLVHSDSTDVERQNAQVWDEISQRVEDVVAERLKLFGQETLGPFVAAYESRLRKLEEQIPLLALLQGQQTIIGLLAGMVKEREDK